MGLCSGVKLPLFSSLSRLRVDLTLTDGSFGDLIGFISKLKSSFSRETVGV